MTTEALNAAIAGRRRAHFTSRSVADARREWIGSPAIQRASSSASTRADPRRLSGSLLKHLRQIVSRSRSTEGSKGSRRNGRLANLLGNPRPNPPRRLAGL